MSGMVLAISFWKLKSASTLETSGHDEMNPTICFTIALVGPLGTVHKGICGAKHWVPWRPLTKQKHPTSLQSPCRVQNVQVRLVEMQGSEHVCQHVAARWISPKS